MPDEADLSRGQLLRAMNNDELKNHRKELEAAINKVLTDSPLINEAIGKIRLKGYDVFLIVEATIGFSHRNGEDSPEETPRLPSAVRLELTDSDEKFLRSLKINPD